MPRFARLFGGEGTFLQLFCKIFALLSTFYLLASGISSGKKLQFMIKLEGWEYWCMVVDLIQDVSMNECLDYWLSINMIGLVILKF